MSDEEVLVKFYGGRAEYLSGKVYKVGDKRL